VSEASLERLAGETDGYTAANLAQIVDRAAKIALRDDLEQITFRELAEAFQDVSSHES
jgi:ATP-dependent 26S proteasome regulatory subunit